MVGTHRCADFNPKLATLLKMARPINALFSTRASRELPAFALTDPTDISCARATPDNAKTGTLRPARSSGGNKLGGWTGTQNSKLCDDLRWVSGNSEL
jgi:hypothetical protein